MKLYYSKQSRSTRPRWVLEELVLKMVKGASA